MRNGALVSLKEALGTLNPKEKRIALYILNDPGSIVNLSVQKLAELSDVSVATIVRLSRTLNFNGFKELKMSIAADLAKASKNTDSYQEIPVNGSIPSLIESISVNNTNSIQDTLAVLSVDAVEQAIEQLRNARRIAIFGVGASAIISQDLYQKLIRINRWCEVAFDSDAQATLATNMTKADVAFGISYSGQTISVIDSLSIAKQNHATIISLTKFSKNPVAELADIKLFVSSLEQSIRSGAMASRIAQLNVIDILYIGILSEKLEENIQYLEKTRQAVKRGKRI